ncbi:MAG TPA: hypothetical protein VI815_02680 [Candidatus Nanoarchaeia archaeon]|nr:hypothetical protein [Candidatus Nanoarchaeia archaeon]
MINIISPEQFTSLSNSEAKLLFYLFLCRSNISSQFNLNVIKKSFDGSHQQVFFLLNKLEAAEHFEYNINKNELGVLFPSGFVSFHVEDWTNDQIIDMQSTIFENDLTTIEGLIEQVYIPQNIYTKKLEQLSIPATSKIKCTTKTERRKQRKKEQAELMKDPKFILAIDVVEYLYLKLKEKNIREVYLTTKDRNSEIRKIFTLVKANPSVSLEEYQKVVDYFTSHTNFWQKVIIDCTTLQKNFFKGLVQIKAANRTSNSHGIKFL